jgi:hypothetical protein
MLYENANRRLVGSNVAGVEIVALELRKLRARYNSKEMLVIVAESLRKR